ncbi:MAG: tetratricopeptide repeat protein [Oligoflexia bacterium]|nr:tetratricopeptide repeat protein [Oligoflexia bacterium]
MRGTPSRRDRNTLAVCLLAMGLILGANACSTTRSQGEKSDNDRAVAYIDAASVALSSNDLAGALAYALQAEKIEPSSAAIQHLKALIFAARGDHATAIECARKAVELDPKSPTANNTLGKLLLDNGRGQEAVPHLMLAANDPLNREAFKAWTNLGIYYYRKMDYAKSIDALDRAIAAGPLNACIALYYRGHIHMAQGKLPQAINDYDSSTRKFCADFADGRVALGIAYERDHQYEKARRTFLEVLDRFKDNTNVAERATQHLKSLP